MGRTKIRNVNLAVWRAADWAVCDAMSGSVSGFVRDAVYGAVRRAVWRAAYDAVFRTVCEDPPHPALEDFLREVG